jgi:hypothetical protein
MTDYVQKPGGQFRSVFDDGSNLIARSEPATSRGPSASGYYPLPACDIENQCRICQAPLKPFHDRSAKYCGLEPCPTARGFALEYQKAG